MERVEALVDLQESTQPTLVVNLDHTHILVGRCAPPPSRPLRAFTEIAVTAVREGADLAATDDSVFGAAIRTLLGERSPDELAWGDCSAIGHTLLPSQVIR